MVVRLLIAPVMIRTNTIRILRIPHSQQLYAYALLGLRSPCHGRTWGGRHGHQHYRTTSDELDKEPSYSELYKAYKKSRETPAQTRRRRRKWSDKDQDKEPVPEHLSAAVYRNYLLRQKSSDPDVMQRMVEFDGQDFNAVNIATLLNQITKSQELLKSFTRHEFDQILVLASSRLSTHPEEFETWECSTIMHAMGTFGPKRHGPHVELRGKLMQHFQTISHRCQNVELINIFWGYARAKGDKRDAWEHLLSLVESRMENLDVQGFSTVMYSVGYIANDVENSPDEAVLDNIVRHKERLNALPLPQLTDAFLSQVKNYLHHNAKRFRIRQVGNMLYGLVGLRVHDKEIMDYASSIFRNTFRRNDAQNLVNVLWALAKANHDDKRAFQDAMPVLKDLFEAGLREGAAHVENKSKEIDIQNAVKVLWAYWAVGCVSPQFFKRISDYLSIHTEQMNSSQLAVASWVLSSSGIHVPIFWERLCEGLKADNYAYSLDVDCAVTIYWSLSFARAGDSDTAASLMKVISHNRSSLDHIMMPLLIEALEKRRIYPSRLLRSISVQAASLFQDMSTNSILNIATVYAKGRVPNVDHLFNAMARTLEYRAESKFKRGDDTDITMQDLCRACSILAKSGHYSSYYTSNLFRKVVSWLPPRKMSEEILAPHLVDVLWAVVVIRLWDANFINVAFQTILHHVSSPPGTNYDSLSILLQDKAKLSRLHQVITGTASLAPRGEDGCSDAPARLPEWLLTLCKSAHNSVGAHYPEFLNLAANILYKHGYVSPICQFVDPQLGFHIDIAWNAVPVYDANGNASLLKVGLFLDSRRRFAPKSRKSRKKYEPNNGNHKGTDFQAPSFSVSASSFNPPEGFTRATPAGYEAYRKTAISSGQPNNTDETKPYPVQSEEYYHSYSSTEGSGWSDLDSGSESSDGIHKAATGSEGPKALLPWFALERQILEQEGWTIVSITYQEVAQEIKSSIRKESSRKKSSQHEVEEALTELLQQKLPPELLLWGR